MAILTHAQQIAKAERFIAQKKDRETQGRERNLRNLVKAQEAQAKRRRAQAGLVALDHAQGMTLAQLAQKYRTSIPAIQEKLKHADRYHLLENYTAATINELVPQAMAVYDQTMSDLYHEVNKTVVDVATKVLEGTGVIGREKAVTMTSPSEEGGIQTIEEYRAMRITRMQSQQTGGVGENGRLGIPGRGAVLDAHQAGPGRDLDGEFAELPEGGDGVGQDPAGSHPQDQGCGGQVP